jgi:hypothetical protein
MKIGILTFWWTEDNYGQLLQCYALQKYLRDHGHDAYLIRYDSRQDFKKSTLFERASKATNFRTLIKYCRERISKARSRKEWLSHPRMFKKFLDEYVKQSERIYTSYEQLKLYPPEADVYIVGSDQVWNFTGIEVGRHKNILHSFFLDFGADETKRISYAASWGRTDIDEKIVEEISPLLREFSFITVRERSGITCCQKCGVNHAEWVCDPTMLLGCNEYRALYSAKDYDTIKEPYILFYFLGNDRSFSVKSVYKWAVTKRLKVLYVSGNAQYDRYPKEYPTIHEWLYLVDRAEYIITNSYHCCIFALLFNKKFGSIPLNGSNSSMNERLVSLFELVKMEPRFINDSDFSCVEKDLGEYSLDGYNLEAVLNHITKY